MTSSTGLDPSVSIIRSLVCYDINALWNFVADAPRVVGFDPFAELADYLEGLDPRVF